MKRLSFLAIQSSMTVCLVVVAVLIPSNCAIAQEPTSAASAKHTTLRGIVVDPVGAVVQNAHIEILAPLGEVLAKTSTQPDGTFEVSSPAETITLTVYAQGFRRFKKELNLAQSTPDRLEVKFTLECSADIKHVIPQQPDSRHLLLEIHYYGAFGDCPQRTYRVWGTGEASVTYSACGGKTFRNIRFIKPSVLTSALAELAKQQSASVCDYYAGGIDAPRVELTIISGSEPRLVISHDESDEVPVVSGIERQLEKLIDPERRMQSFAAESKSQSRRK